MSRAENYEKFLVPIIMDHWAREMVRTVKQGDRILDIGCGTGIVTRHAAAITGESGSIVGLDMSPEMLEVARLISLPCPNIVSWVEADAAAMPFAERAFDTVLCQFGFMFMSDKPAALREMRRVTKPGGSLGLSVFVSNPYDQALKRALSKHALPDDADFAIWSCGDPEWLRSLVEKAGFQIVTLKKQSNPSRYKSVRQSLELMKDWSQTIAGLPADTLEQITRDIEAELSHCITADGFFCPEPVNIVIARAI